MINQITVQFFHEWNGQIFIVTMPTEGPIQKQNKKTLKFYNLLNKDAKRYHE